jgi:hypothetical protein
MTTVSEMRAISLPAALCSRAEKKFGDTFGNLEQLLEYILGELVRDDAVQLDERENNLVEQRLRELGYL